MAKSSGLGDNLYVAGYDLSGDTGALSRIAGGLVGTQDVTGIDKSAMERIGLLRDGGVDWTAFFNPAAGQAHEVLSTLPTADRIVTYCRGTTLGNSAAACVAKQINYDPTRGADGSLTIAVQAQANGYGLEWGRQLTAGLRTDTGAANGTGVDYGTGSTSFGAQAYLQVTAFTGTDVTITVEDSTDNVSFATLVAFTQVASAPTTERVTVSGNVDRYLRVSTSTTGGFSSVTFSVVVNRNDTATAF